MLTSRILMILFATNLIVAATCVNDGREDVKLIGGSLKSLNEWLARGKLSQMLFSSTLENPSDILNTVETEIKKEMECKFQLAALLLLKLNTASECSVDVIGAIDLLARGLTKSLVYPCERLRSVLHYVVSKVSIKCEQHFEESFYKLESSNDVDKIREHFNPKFSIEDDEKQFDYCVRNRVLRDFRKENIVSKCARSKEQLQEDAIFLAKLYPIDSHLNSALDMDSARQALNRNIMRYFCMENPTSKGNPLDLIWKFYNYLESAAKLSSSHVKQFAQRRSSNFLATIVQEQACTQWKKMPAEDFKELINSQALDRIFQDN